MPFSKEEALNEPNMAYGVGYKCPVATPPVASPSIVTPSVVTPTVAVSTPSMASPSIVTPSVVTPTVVVNTAQNENVIDKPVKCADVVQVEEWSSTDDECDEELSVLPNFLSNSMSFVSVEPDVSNNLSILSPVSKGKVLADLVSFEPYYPSDFFGDKCAKSEKQKDTK